jgi:nucleolar protein 9
MLVAALSRTSQNPVFHKSIVASLVPHIASLASSQMGHNLVNEIISIPSKSKERSVPFHVKESIMSQLAGHEAELRESWMGRSVWRTWKGDLWKRKRADWILWVKEVDGPTNSWASAPTKRIVTRDERQGENGKGKTEFVADTNEEKMEED